MKVGDRIRVFEITEQETAMPEIIGKHFAELQTNGWFGTSCVEIPHRFLSGYWAVIVDVQAKQVCTMVIKSIKNA